MRQRALALAGDDVVEAWMHSVRSQLHGSQLGKNSFSTLLERARSIFTAHLDKSDEQVGVNALIATARSELARDQPQSAASIARQALRVARSKGARCTLIELLAWAAIAEKDPFRTHDALLGLPQNSIPPFLLASYLRCCNRNDEALELLQEMRRAGPGSREVTKLLIDLLFLRQDYASMRAVADEDEGLLSVDDREAIRLALAQA